jgi:methionyl-tRNA synthetase
MAPYLPFSSDTIWKMLGNTDSITSWDDALSRLKEGTPLEKPAPLFKKLVLEDIVEEADPFSKLDLRVAKIIDVKDHPQADKLYLMQLDLGPLGKRIIVAGIKPCYSKEELNGKSIIIVTNLKSATIRGIQSKGMLLAAEDDQGDISLLDPKDATPGTEIFVEGIPREPVSVLEFDDFKQVIMTIGDKQEVVYNGKPLKSKNDTVVTDKKVKIGVRVS